MRPYKRRRRRSLSLWLLLPILTSLSPPVAHAGAPAGKGVSRDERGHQRMVTLLAELAEETLQAGPNFSLEAVEHARSRLARLPPGTERTDRAEALAQLGIAEESFGSLDRALIHLSTADLLLRAPESEREGMVRSLVDYHLGIDYLRLAHRERCTVRRSSRDCRFPPPPGEDLPAREALEKAIRHLRELVDAVGRDTVEGLAGRWLLTVATAEAGRPLDPGLEEMILPSNRFASEAELPSFEEVAPQVGLDAVDHAGGAVVDDFDGDGRLDVVTSSCYLNENLHFFVNAGDGTFRDRTEEANLTGITGGLNMVQGDFDGDGDFDLLVLRGAWLQQLGRHPNSLLRNNGHGVFTDVTFAAGLARESYPTQTAAWADYDNDGDLDLYVGNEATQVLPFPSQLFRNNDDGTFTDVAEQAGVKNLRIAKGVAWGDVDGDGLVDLYVSNFQAENRLYRNRGDSTFTDIAEEAGVTGPKDSFPAWFWDFDNDGALDLFVSSYPAARSPERLLLGLSSYLGLPVAGETMRLYKGDGHGKFTDVTADRHLDRIVLAMGSNFGDLNNDGYPDVYLGTGYPSYEAFLPNMLLENQGGRRFLDVTAQAGVGHLEKGHGVAFADLDQDGDLDLFEQMGGFFRESAFANALYVNPGFGNHWLEIELVGVRSNRRGVGAGLRVVIEEEGGESRSIYALVGSGGSFGANPLTQHLGLGRAVRIERVEVLWPATGATQTFTGVPLDVAIELTEGQDGFRTLPRTRIRLPDGAIRARPLDRSAAVDSAGRG